MVGLGRQSPCQCPPNNAAQVPPRSRLVVVAPSCIRLVDVLGQRLVGKERKFNIAGTNKIGSEYVA